ncbi:MAG: tetratricopeptide repeat protein [Bacteroidales bacterium]|nr:tetratricopeptide repeat protein [Bacteroidales bacterium]
MIKFDTFYIKCPSCGCNLEGHIVRSEMVNKSVLFSDGKILNDTYITETQKFIICPSCSHWFWVDKYEEPVISYTKPDGPCYNWNHWRFFGVRFSKNAGRLALKEHYRQALEVVKGDRDKELYLRRLMWWAYNDLVRNNYQGKIRYLLSGAMSFNVWRKNRQKLLEGRMLFKKYHEEYIGNLKALLVLLKGRYTPEDEEYEASTLEIIELYREMGEYDEAQKILNTIPRRTHYIANIEKEVKKRHDFVFLVVG